MDLAQFLGSIGVTVEAAVVRDVVKQTLRIPSASPSDLVEALAVTLNPSGARVIVDRSGAVDGGAAGKIVSFLIEQGEIRIEDRHVFATEKFAVK